MKLIIIPLLLISLNVMAEQKYHYEVTRVVDGDTFEFTVPFLPKQIRDMKLRIIGIDSPEKGSLAQCERERVMGELATQFAVDIMETAADITMTIEGWDKYGGRVLGDLFINGMSYKKIILDKGYAREYNGDKKKSWCK